MINQGFVHQALFCFGMKKLKNQYILIKHIGSVRIERGKQRDYFTKGFTKTNDKVFSRNLHTKDKKRKTTASIRKRWER